jgi:hypothetical protein
MTNRYSVHLRIEIRPIQLSAFTEGKGTTIAMSSGGCEITSDLTCYEGQDLEVRIHVPDLDWPLRIEQARVLWIRGSAVGLQFLQMSARDMSELRELLGRFSLDEHEEVELCPTS